MDKVRRVAAVLAAAASVSTVVGSVLPVFGARLGGGGAEAVELTITQWTSELTNGYALADAPANGYPLLFAAALLAFAAHRCWAATRPGVPPRTGRVAGVATVAGAAFLVCAVWMIAVQVRYWVDSYGPHEVGEGLRVGAETSVLAGLWVLVAAGLLGVAAAVVALLPGARAEPVVEPVDPDAPTPPFGLALSLPEPVEEVDPLTGLPFGQEPPSAPEVRDDPIAIPDAPPLEPPPGPAVPPTEDPLAEPRRD
jgi:hypothetical protein